MKGVSILWIALFHFLTAYGGNFPWPVGFASFGAFMDGGPHGTPWEFVLRGFHGVVVAVLQRGMQGVGVFIVLSGFGLALSAWKGVASGTEPRWGEWYRKRLFRLFPMYWTAHGIYLLSPFILRREPIDYRFLLSFFGDRIFPVDTVFYYICPAWWFFGLLLELYLVFPLLFFLLKKFGTARYLFLCIVISVVVRYLLINVFHAHSNWVQGACFASRLWEFGAGMAAGRLFVENAGSFERRLFSPLGFLAGAVVYALGVWSYQPNVLYTLSDGLMGTGLAVVIAHVAAAIGRLKHVGPMVTTVGAGSYGLYLIHQPYAIYFGERLRGLGLSDFLAVSGAVVILIALVSLGIENGVNHLVKKLAGTA